jgi:hypothetical protein
VQELFRAAVRRSASSFPAGVGQGFGTGIVNAESLLSLTLDCIVPAEKPKDGNPGSEMFPEVAGDERFAAETGFLGMDAEQRSDPALLLKARRGTQLRVLLEGVGCGRSGS